jgi:putative membrane protein
VRSFSPMQLVRGFFMGAADIVPGVSGGTVALLFGIYERLILNIRNVATAIGHVLQRDLTGARDRIRSVEWLWLVALLAGILIAIASLSAVLEHLLDEEPVRMAGLFFGLILGSVIVAWRLVKSTSVEVVVIGLLTAIAFFVFLGIRSDTSSDAAEIVTKPLWLFFLVGMIAICAMILPGISGSFLLVMMGMYSEVLGAVNERDVIVLLVFAAGCAVGLALFSTLLEWLLEHHHDRVIAAMIGLMLGSLRVLWPWPGGTATTTMSAPRGDVLVPVLLALAGFVVVMGVELFVARSTRRHTTHSPSSENV